jgi:hypothetical protein
MVELKPSKLTTRVRFPSPAPKQGPLAHVWLEQRTHNPLVPGSTPGRPTNSGKCVRQSKNAGLAHQVEQLICNHQVAGSSPAAGTKNFKCITGEPVRFLV